MLIDISNNCAVFISFKPRIEIISIDRCSKQLLINEANKLKQYLYTNIVETENKIQIYGIIRNIYEVLQNRTNKEAINAK